MNKEDFNKGISVILPAFNEEKNIKEAVGEAVGYLRTIKAPWEVIVVNDGSTDRTGEIVKKCFQRNKKVRLIEHSVNLGYGQSLSDGFAASKHKYVFFTDSDRQFDIKALDVMWPLAKTEVVELVVGYRKNRQDPFLRKFLSRSYNILADWLFDLDVKDIDCAFKIFNKTIFKKIKIESKHFFINTEILAKARFFKFKIVEVDVAHFPRQAGKSTVSLKYVPLTIKELFRIKRNLGKLKKQPKQ